jgi:hypothetical protein
VVLVEAVASFLDREARQTLSLEQVITVVIQLALVTQAVAVVLVLSESMDLVPLVETVVQEPQILTREVR